MTPKYSLLNAWVSVKIKQPLPIQKKCDQQILTDMIIIVSINNIKSNINLKNHHSMTSTFTGHKLKIANHKSNFNTLNISLSIQKATPTFL